MNDVSLFRLYVLRALYLFIAVGLGVEVWPDVIHHARPWALMEGVANCMLAAFGALALLGLRYPLQMLPILFWELLWKAMWLLIVALPLWQTGQMDKATAATAFACLIGVIVPVAIPWRYVFAQYLRKPGDRWLNENPVAGLRTTSRAT